MNQDIVIYHNPRCSKSRQSLALLEQSNMSFKIKKYLEEPLKEEELKGLIERLEIEPQELLRTKEPEYKLAGLKANDDNDTVISAIVKYPKLMERPIIDNGDRAVIGRPPENVEKIIQI
ncbi:MAG: arsenate reductase (glutaredoxin) [Rickettsiales bacterium]|nr:arsenate reductase (glutaredoxin) [Rickettsiales bacterium]